MLRLSFSEALGNVKSLLLRYNILCLKEDVFVQVGFDVICSELFAKVSWQCLKSHCKNLKRNVL